MDDHFFKTLEYISWYIHYSLKLSGSKCQIISRYFSGGIWQLFNHCSCIAPIIQVMFDAIKCLKDFESMRNIFHLHWVSNKAFSNIYLVTKSINDLDIYTYFSEKIQSA